MPAMDRYELEKQVSDDKKKYLHKLIEQRDQLVDQIRSLSAASLTSNRQAGEELADVGGDDFMREIELSLVGEEEKVYYLIEEALERLRNGSYGNCVDCNGDIPDGRLEAIPYAKLCVHCKEERERNGGMPPEKEPEQAEKLVE
mgnify:CR=1 FL=1